MIEFAFQKNEEVNRFEILKRSESLWFAYRRTPFTYGRYINISTYRNTQASSSLLAHSIPKFKIPIFDQRASSAQQI